MLRYLKHQPTVFDPDTVHLLSGALDDAWQIVEANKATFKLDGQAEDARAPHSQNTLSKWPKMANVIDCV